MTFDDSARSFERDALDHVGIQGPLYEVCGILDLRGFFFEHVDEDLPDDLPLLFGIRDADEGREETLAGVHRDEVQVERLTKRVHDLLELALPEDTVVDED